jgi:hypothetical protein
MSGCGVRSMGYGKHHEHAASNLRLSLAAKDLSSLMLALYCGCYAATVALCWPCSM